MDVIRTDVARTRRRRTIGAAAAGAAILVVTLVFASSRTTMPSVDRDSLTIATVEEGPLVRQVRGHGAFISDETAVVVATTSGRVARLTQEVGARVTPDTVIAELINPDVEQAVLEAKTAYEGALAALANVRADVEADSLAQRSAYEALALDYDDARARAEVAASLAEQGIGSEAERKLLERHRANREQRLKLEAERLRATERSSKARLEAEQSRADQARHVYDLRKRQADALAVRAGAHGVLQDLVVDVGQALAAGTPVGKVTNPQRLKIRASVAQADARFLQPGQPATVQVGDRTLPARVQRIDPAVKDSSVSIDLALAGELPGDVRPDLSVEVAVDVGRVEKTLKIRRPARLRARTARLFRLDESSATATRVPVEFGRESLLEVEILSGAKRGDQLVVSTHEELEEVERIVVR